MDILICQSCGVIIRSKSRFCVGCGSTISKFSPVTLPVIVHALAPLAVNLEPDPLVLERALFRIKFASLPQGTPNNAKQTAGNVDNAGQAAAASSSKLQNILGTAAARSMPGEQPPAPAEVSLEQETVSEPAEGAVYNNAAAEPPEGEEAAEEEAAAAPVLAQPAGGSAPPDAGQAAATPPAQSAPSAQAPVAQPPAPAPAVAAVTPAAQPPTPAPAVETSAAPPPAPAPVAAPSTPAMAPAPISVTTAISPGLDAGSVVDSRLLQAQPQASVSIGTATIVSAQTTVTPAPAAAETPSATVSQSQPPLADQAPAAPISQAPPPPVEPTPAAPANPTPPPTTPAEQPPPASTPAPASLNITAPAPLVTTPASTTQQPALTAPPSSLDFFAQQPLAFSPVAAPAPAPATTQTATPAPLPSAAPPDQTKFGNGVPSVIQQAISRAAAAQDALREAIPDPPAGQSAETRIADTERSQQASDRDNKTGDKPGIERNSDEDRKKTANKQTEPDKSISIGGKQYKMKSVLTAGILVLFLGIPGIIFILTLLGGLAGKMAGASNEAYLGGDWEFGVLNGGRNIKGTINLQQAGNTFTGMGMDDYGAFRITGGVFQPAARPQPKLQFQKIYVDQQGRPKGKAITFGGVVDWVNPEPGKGNIPFLAHMYGIWQFQKREGYGWRGQIVTKSGKWEAGQIRMDKHRDTMPRLSVGGWDPFGWVKQLLAFPDDGSPAKMAQFFARLAGGLLLLGLALVAASVKMFGPAGLLNIWSKKEYIPSQFKSQHYRMVKELGSGLKPGGLPLGWRADWNITQFWWPRKLALTPDIRTVNPHLLMLGAGAKGKSRLMASMIYHDIESNDRAVVVIDSDGGMIDLLLSKISTSPQAAEIARRIIIIDPTRNGDTYAYNPLEYPDDGDLQNAASAVVFGFKAIYTEPPGAQSQWNQQTANILRNSAILLMANGKTLTDLPVLLSENDFRDILLEKVERMRNEKSEYTTLLEAWNQYKRLARTDQWINWVEPILNRVQPMLGDPRIRPILTKAKGDLNLKDIITEGKILFVKVPQGQLDQNANLLGSLIVTGLKQAAMSLAVKTNSRKHPCALYLDEFDNFIEKETYDAITSETKKFQIGFIGASKTLQGLPEDYRSQLIINCGTMACFALAKKDGDMLGPQMFRVDGRKIKHQTLQNIFNKVNTAPQFELISDEEKLNIDRVVGQEERHYFCYRVGTVAGVFNMRAPDFDDPPEKDIDWALIDQIYSGSKATARENR